MSNLVVIAVVGSHLHHHRHYRRAIYHVPMMTCPASVVESVSLICH